MLIAKAYHNFLRKFDKFLSWQVISYLAESLIEFIFGENSAIMLSEGFGFKNRNFWGFFPGKRPQNHFLTGGAKAAA